MAELPVAQLTALMANVNRDPKKTKAFGAMDFVVYTRKEDDKGGRLSPEVAAVALALRHEKRASAILLCAWTDILASVREGTRIPEVRALHSQDEAIWILAPQWEGPNVRGGLVCVHGQISGPIKMRDIDRPLATYTLVFPKRHLGAWIEGGLLLPAAAEN